MYHIEDIRDTLQSISWSHDTCAIKAEYGQACADEEHDERARIDAEDIVSAKKTKHN